MAFNLKLIDSPADSVGPQVPLGQEAQPQPASELRSGWVRLSEAACSGSAVPVRLTDSRLLLVVPLCYCCGAVAVRHYQCDKARPCQWARPETVSVASRCHVTRVILAACAVELHCGTMTTSDAAS